RYPPATTAALEPTTKNHFRASRPSVEPAIVVALADDAVVAAASDAIASARLRAAAGIASLRAARRRRAFISFASPSTYRRGSLMMHLERAFPGLGFEPPQFRNSRAHAAAERRPSLEQARAKRRSRSS